MGSTRLKAGWGGYFAFPELFCGYLFPPPESARAGESDNPFHATTSARVSPAWCPYRECATCSNSVARRSDGPCRDVAQRIGCEDAFGSPANFIGTPRALRIEKTTGSHFQTARGNPRETGKKKHWVQRGFSSAPSPSPGFHRDVLSTLCQEGK